MLVILNPTLATSCFSEKCIVTNKVGQRVGWLNSDNKKLRNKTSTTLENGSKKSLTALIMSSEAFAIFKDIFGAVKEVRTLDPCMSMI